MSVRREGVFGSDRSDMASGPYIIFAIEEVRKIVDYLKTDTTAPVHILLANISILLTLIHIIPNTFCGTLKKSEIKVWRDVFNQHYEKTKMKIPKKFRESIKVEGDKLFDELYEYGHDIAWLD